MNLMYAARPVTRALIAVIAAALAHSSINAAPADLRLRGTKTGLEVLNAATGSVLGEYTRPVSDTEGLDGETFSLHSSKVSERSASLVWRSSRGYELFCDYTVAEDPARVKTRVAARNVTAGAKQAYVYFPFEPPAEVLQPACISFTLDGGVLQPFEAPLPGEGLTTFWGTADFNLARTTFEMLLPVAAVQNAEGMTVTGCRADSAFALRIHRSTRIEWCRRFFLGEEKGSTDDAMRLLGVEPDCPYEYYTGWTGRISWADLYHDWYLALEKEYSGVGAARVESTGSPVSGLGGLLEMATRASGDSADSPFAAEKMRDSIILTSSGARVPDGPGWKVNPSPRYSFGTALLGAIREKAGSSNGLLLRLGEDSNRVDRTRALPPYPFFPLHAAEAELAAPLAAALHKDGKVLASAVTHPASPCLKWADIVAIDPQSPYAIGIRLAAGYRATAALSSPGATETDAANALFLGLAPMTDTGGPDGAGASAVTAPGPFTGLGRSVVAGGNAQGSSLQFAGVSGDAYTSFRNTRAERWETPAVFDNPRLRVSRDTDYAVFLWRSDGSISRLRRADGAEKVTWADLTAVPEGDACRFSGSSLQTLEMPVTLGAGQTALVGVVPVSTAGGPL